MEIYIIILSLLLSAVFSGTEIAYFTSNKLKIELLKKQGLLSGRLMAHFIKYPSEFLSTILVGNNVVLITFGIFMTQLTEPLIRQILPLSFQSEFYLLLSQTFITTFIILIGGEFIPKIIFRINPDGLFQTFVVPVTFFYYLFYPLVFLVHKISDFILKKLINADTVSDKPIFNRIDLEGYLEQFIKSEKTENTSDIDTEIFENVLYLPQIKARECMVPRSEIIGVDITTSLTEIENQFTTTKLSRLIVYQNSIDHIVGYIHHLSLLKKPNSIAEILFPVEVIPESMPAKELLHLFTKKNKIIAWVVDEFGGTSGIITMEDVLEEIFGEIKDEHDVEDLLEKTLNKDEYLFAGRLEVDYLNEKYNLQIPKGEYETLSGYILNRYGDFPSKNEIFKIDHFVLEVKTSSKKRIDAVKLKLENTN